MIESPFKLPLAQEAPLPLLSRMALFLDLDGTLAEIAPTPQAVTPLARRTRLVRRASQLLGGRLAVVSGRPIREIDHILEGAAPAAAGLHGLERRDDTGAFSAPAPHPGLAEARRELEAFVLGRKGLFLEDKKLSLALHFRLAPDVARQARTLVQMVAEQTGLLSLEGDCVAELRPPGANKGDALVAFMRQPPFKGAVPVFVGDDITDEDGFRAARLAGGAGVLVGPPRRSHAQWRLDDVTAVLAWLEAGLGSERAPAPFNP